MPQRVWCWWMMLKYSELLHFIVSSIQHDVCLHFILISDSTKSFSFCGNDPICESIVRILAQHSNSEQTLLASIYLLFCANSLPAWSWPPLPSWHNIPNPITTFSETSHLHHTQELLWCGVYMFVRACVWATYVLVRLGADFRWNINS